MKIQTNPTARSLAANIPAGRHTMRGTLVVPDGAQGVVVFAHGSGSGRFSPRNQFVAERLQQKGLGTLLIDILDEDEAEDRDKVFDIELLAERVRTATTWLREQPATGHLQLGYFGASTGAAAALVAAAGQGDEVAAIVSRGGRPDLADNYLPRVNAPTLLIVGGDDDVVLDLNQQALQLLRCPKEMVVIPGATHLFPEPGALEKVAELAAVWFQRYLSEGEGHVSEP